MIDNPEGAPPKLQSADLSLTTAMIIEDQPSILKLAADCLKILRVGQILPVSSAFAARQMITDIVNNPSSAGVSHIDFALVDWNLVGNPFAETPEQEDQQGPDICRWVRQVEFGRFMPILAISGYSSKDVITDMINAGVNGYLSKPFSVHDLSRQVQRMVSDIKPYIITPSNYFGPDRRRVKHKVSKERRRSQNGVRSFNPPRTLRQKTSGTVDIPETDVSKIMLQMREIAPPEYCSMVDMHLQQIKTVLNATPTEITDEASAETTRKNCAEINFLCNEILGNPGGFTYQMIAETMASMSRFVVDKHFLPSKQAHAMLQQQIATAEFIIQRKMKGSAKGEMRKLFTESFTVIEKVLRQNRLKSLDLK